MVEKETTAIIEAVRSWSHFSKSRRFTLVTDEEVVSFIFDQSNRGKIKTPRILKLELSHMTYDIRHKPGRKDVAVNASSHACVSSTLTSLQNLHQYLGHPGYARL